jgi:hypothetical protein
MLMFNTTCLFICAVYRVIELSDGWSGRIIHTQVYFSAFILCIFFSLDLDWGSCRTADTLIWRPAAPVPTPIFPHRNSIHFNREFAMQPFEPSDGCLALRKWMANGSNGFDTCPYFWSH